MHRIKAIFQIFKEMVKESTVGQPEAPTNNEDENTLSINESIRDLNRQVNLFLYLPFLFFIFIENVRQEYFKVKLFDFLAVAFFVILSSFSFHW